MSATSLAVRASCARLAERPLGALLRARSATALAAAVLAASWIGLIATHHGRGALPLPSTAAVADLRTDPATAAIMPTLRWNRSVATRLDPRDEAVWLLEGPRLVLTAVVSASGHVAYDAVPARRSYAYGSNIPNFAPVLLLMCGLFSLMTGVRPLWRLRNLDVAVAAGSVLVIVLLNAGMLDRMVLVAYPGLVYFAARTGWRALGRARPPRPSVPLYDSLTAGWSGARRLRLLRIILAASALVLAMVGLSSNGVIDVGYAVMEGATVLTHGILPYGHITDVLHGDTYPLGSYLLYMPFALLSPVRTQWDDADVTVVVAVVAALLAAWGIMRAARRGASAGAGRPQDPAAPAGAGRPQDPGTEVLRAPIAWLTFPPLLVTVSTGTTDVVLAAALVAALALWRRPGISATVVSAAAWFKLAPVALLPLWLAPLRGRRLIWPLSGIAAVSAAMVAVLIGLGGAHGPSTMLHAIGYQSSRDSLNSLWAVVGSVPLQQLAQAATLALIAGAAVRLRRDPALARDTVRIAALAGAVILGLQLSANYWSYMYLVWAYPCLALSLFASTGSTRLA